MTDTEKLSGIALRNAILKGASNTDFDFSEAKFLIENGANFDYEFSESYSIYEALKAGGFMQIDLEIFSDPEMSDEFKKLADLCDIMRERAILNDMIEDEILDEYNEIKNGKPKKQIEHSPGL